MEIEKNVPVPVMASYKYPFDAMEIGDSIFVEDQQSRRTAANAAYMYGKRNGKKFKARTGPEAMRIWRIE